MLLAAPVLLRVPLIRADDPPETVNEIELLLAMVVFAATVVSPLLEVLNGPPLKLMVPPLVKLNAPRLLG